MAKNLRADHTGPFRNSYLRNRKKIIQSQDTCAICGRYVDKSLKAPDPYSPTVDHIIPLNKGGHPSDISNLQLAHWICNRLKSDKIGIDRPITSTKNQTILQTIDWQSF